jgi:hypothetical protein
LPSFSEEASRGLPKESNNPPPLHQKELIVRICKEHWDMCRSAIDDRGMAGLIAKSGEAAHADIVAELQGEPDPRHQRFDPLMSMNWHWNGIALKAGGLAMMGEGPESNSGHLCPLCELAAHYNDFQPAAEISTVADQMLAWARGEGLVPKAA